MRAYIPRNFVFALEFPNEGKYKDKYLYIINIIIQARVFHKYDDAESYVPVKAALLRSIIGRHCKRYIDELIKAKVIESDNHYIAGEKSIGYRLTENYRVAGIKEIVIRDKRINKKVALHKEEQEKEIPIEIEYQTLKKWNKQIEIDYDKAIQSIEEERLDEIIKCRQKFYKNKLKFTLIPTERDFYILKFLNELEKIKIELITIQDKFSYDFISIEKIHNKEFFFHIDNTAGRIHTNIVNLRSELRQFLRYKGERIYNIDIRNSQPFLFNILLKDFFQMKYKISFSNHPPYFIFKSNIPPYDGKISSLYDGSSNSLYDGSLKDVKLYMELTSSGNLYEYLMEKMNLNGLERNEFKKEFFGKVFFSKNSYNYWWKEKKIFKKHFPNVYKAIHYFKKDAHRNLAIMLQKAEVNIIINTIVRRISMERPEMFLTTIHDSIMVIKENIEYVKSLMLEEFEKKFDLKPALKLDE